MEGLGVDLAAAESVVVAAVQEDLAVAVALAAAEPVEEVIDNYHILSTQTPFSATEG